MPSSSFEKHQKQSASSFFTSVAANDSSWHSATSTPEWQHTITVSRYCTFTLISASFSQIQRTSNVTSFTEVRSASARLFAGKWRPLMNVINNTLLCCDYFSSSSMVLCAFSACIRQNKTLGIFFIVQATFVPNFVSFITSKPWRKIAYSITHSLTELIWCPGNRRLAIRNKKTSTLFPSLYHSRTSVVSTNDHKQLSISSIPQLIQQLQWNPTETWFTLPDHSLPPPRC